MTPIKSYTIPVGDCPVNITVDYYTDGPNHILKGPDQTLTLSRPPKQVDLLLVSDPRPTEDVRFSDFIQTLPSP